MRAEREERGRRLESSGDTREENEQKDIVERGEKTKEQGEKEESD